MSITALEYQQVFFDTLASIRDDILAPSSPGSHIETRYIASEGRDDEQWLSYLRDQNGAVDIWLMTYSGLMGLNDDDQRGSATGEFTKPVSVVLDYYADYKQGLDVVGAIGSETTTNTEHEFLKKVLAVDLLLEKKRRCLQDNVEIKDWSFRLKLRRFDQATTHWASGLVNIDFSQLFL